jgi:hypothetical protein
VNHAGTGAQLDVVGQVHRRQAVVERVTEVDQLQREPVAVAITEPSRLYAPGRLDQLFSQHQQASPVSTRA